MTSLELRLTTTSVPSFLRTVRALRIRATPGFFAMWRAVSATRAVPP